MQMKKLIDKCRESEPFAALVAIAGTIAVAVIACL